MKLISDNILAARKNEPHNKSSDEEFVTVSDMIALINGGFGLNVHSFRKYLLEELKDVSYM